MSGCFGPYLQISSRSRVIEWVFAIALDFQGGHEFKSGSESLLFVFRPYAKPDRVFCGANVTRIRCTLALNCIQRGGSPFVLVTNDSIGTYILQSLVLLHSPHRLSPVLGEMA